MNDNFTFTSIFCQLMKDDNIDECNRNNIFSNKI